jgi:hypothetical protein
MSRRPLVASLALLAAGLAAEDGASPFAQMPGSRFTTPGDQRLVYIHGLLDLDYFGQSNATDGDSKLKDSTHFGQFRSEFGTKVELDENLEVKLTAAYAAHSGDSNGSPDDAVVMDDAYAVLKSVFGFTGLSLKAGRQPVAWNLRTDHGAFLYDSRADHPDVTSWDGMRVQWGVETLVFSPFVYALPDNSEMGGIVVDWQPEQAQDNGLFLTGSLVIQRDPLVYSGPQDTDFGIGDQMETWSGGFEFRLPTFDAYYEGAMQSGKANAGRKFAGYGMYGGFEWHPRAATPQLYGVQLDWLHGDKNQTDGTVHQFIDTWEGVQDTLIAENDKYVEILKPVRREGYGTRDLKLIGEWAFDREGRYKMRAVYARFMLDQPANGSSFFGEEGDLSFTWQYNQAGNAFIGIFGSAFFPGTGYSSTAPSQPAGRDMITLWGGNLLINF